MFLVLVPSNDKNLEGSGDIKGAIWDYRLPACSGFVACLFRTKNQKDDPYACRKVSDKCSSGATELHGD